MERTALNPWDWSIKLGYNQAEVIDSATRHRRVNGTACGGATFLGLARLCCEHADTFDRDRTRSLVARLERNVVKTGLRRLNVSYSRISLDDVRARLHLDSAASAEFVCAKAIKDGVIDAVIDHDNQQIRSKGVADVYSTNEPQKAFHRRIVFCLDVRNEAVKAMQYPPDTGKKKNVEEDDKEEKQTDEEIAKEIEEELGDELP